MPDSPYVWFRDSVAFAARQIEAACEQEPLLDLLDTIVTNVAAVGADIALIRVQVECDGYDPDRDPTGWPQVVPWQDDLLAATRDAERAADDERHWT